MQPFSDPLARDAIALTQALVRVPSVTPDTGAALAIAQGPLASAGFRCRTITRGGVANLLARFGTGAPHFAFAGHTDVVPAGNASDWRFDPFGGVIEGGYLWGRGAVDMKSAVAAMVVAAADFASSAKEDAVSLSLLLTGDEEGCAKDGTLALLDHMVAEGSLPDFCLLGEPTSAARLGDRIKIGRRGSLNAQITARGLGGHAAYPEEARNPLPPLLSLLSRLNGTPLDEGSRHFAPSRLVLTALDTGEGAKNVTPHEARARLNIRFNDHHDCASLESWLREQIAAATDDGHGVAFSFEAECSGESFLVPPGPATAMLAAVIEEESGVSPGYSTGGGTSDARFIRHHCPVAEFGLQGTGMHQANERAEIGQIAALARLYRRFLERCFA